MTKSSKSKITRRHFMQGSAVAGAAIAVSPLFAPSVKAANTIKIGYVSPATGPLAPFAEADEFNRKLFLDSIKSTLKINGQDYAIELISKDSQSNPNRAAEVTKELIVSDKVNLMLALNTPETTNPVATTCEVEEMPCITTNCAVAALLHRASGQSGRSVDVEAVRLHVPLLLGPRRYHRRLQQHVGPDPDQQTGRRTLPE